MSSNKALRHLPVGVLLALCAVVGIFTVSDFGETWDEADIFRYSEYSIHAYRYVLHPAELPEFDTNLNLYGPGYFMAANVGARVLMAGAPGLSSLTAWHFMYFLTYLGGALALYALALRWMSQLAAFGATLLLVSQPLLWGHAFINPKDIPFMACFTAAVCAGFAMADAWGNPRRVWPTTLLAAALFGLASSFRVAGAMSGAIVLGYAAYRHKVAAAARAAAYLCVGALTAFLTWPYLWSAPIAHYLKSITTMTEFPFASSILFADGLYKANQLPWTYFPTLLGLQLTEPALLLSAGGIVVAIVAFARQRTAGPIFLFLAWFLLPATAIVGTRSPLYDNARQLYFMLPPLFIAAGMAFDRLFLLAKAPAGRAAILALAALPGVLLAARLHPYEYVYYNAFVRGTGGAYRHFEMDYWGLSFKELTAHLNSVAPAGTRVLVYGPEQVVDRYARPDINVEIPQSDGATKYDYVMFLTRANVDERRCKGAQTVFSVGRRGAVFSVLRSVPEDIICQ
jgi:hypothetical protein